MYAPDASLQYLKAKVQTSKHAFKWYIQYTVSMHAIRTGCVVVTNQYIVLHFANARTIIAIVSKRQSLMQALQRQVRLNSQNKQAKCTHMLIIVEQNVQLCAILLVCWFVGLSQLVMLPCVRSERVSTCPKG